MLQAFGGSSRHGLCHRNKFLLKEWSKAIKKALHDRRGIWLVIIITLSLQASNSEVWHLNTSYVSSYVQFFKISNHMGLSWGGESKMPKCLKTMKLTWELQKGRGFQNKSLLTQYYSSKIFPCFWLVKTTHIIHNNQLLLTKFGKNFQLSYWTNCLISNHEGLGKSL